MLEWITNTINSLGYIGVAMLMFLENLFPPIPSELIMPLAGFTASPYQPGGAKLNIIGVFFSGLVGSALGALIWYYPGRLLQEQQLKKLAKKYGKWLAISSDDIDKAKTWFNRQGSKAVLIGRLVPGIRTLISIPAGMANMPMLPFLLYTTLGSALWVGFLTYSGYLLGTQYKLVEKYIDPISKIVLVGILVLFFLWVFKRKGQHTR
ncbi:DedA family protein [Cylindrospermopsis raciborskii]|jgi:membrane protein DedA with SNARE-associated domain|uniref:DedA family protein n=1 Tax=Cylindrospermopsis raciborskii TaxID=77022 RepID=UPI000E1E783C|nr:DedA family protein [Cylindrospermopsis raciborskii]UJL32833.1 DedA family protein [Cylindrospermopsis raciborskii Cr2010]UJS05291.1 DedA family protein [Cylindrospermopsis raciborskii KLL07]